MSDLFIDSFDTLTNLSGSPSDIQDDPTTTTTDWLTADDDGVDTEMVGEFENPDGGITDNQTFQYRLRGTDNDPGDNPAFTAELLEGGTVIETFHSGESITQDQDGEYFEGTIDASDISNADELELRIEGDSTGGSPQDRDTVEIGAVKWIAQLDTAAFYEVQITDIQKTSAGEPVHVDYEVTNTGNAPGEQDIILTTSPVEDTWLIDDFDDSLDTDMWSEMTNWGVTQDSDARAGYAAVRTDGDRFDDPLIADTSEVPHNPVDGSPFLMFEWAVDAATYQTFEFNRYAPDETYIMEWDTGDQELYFADIDHGFNQLDSDNMPFLEDYADFTFLWKDDTFYGWCHDQDDGSELASIEAIDPETHDFSETWRYLNGVANDTYLGYVEFVEHHPHLDQHYTDI